MALKKVVPNLVLEKRTTKGDTVSLQFEELCACLKGQYTSMRVEGPTGVRILEGEAFLKTLKDARPIIQTDGGGRKMRGNMSNYYVAQMSA